MRFELPEARKRIFRMTIPIRWGDMDAMGHVNNTVYFRYMETLRIEWMRSVGGAPDERQQGPVVMNTFCNFLRQLTYPGDVVATLYLGQVGRSSFETWYTLSRADDPQTVYASGGATTVWVDFARQRSVPLPEALRAQWENA